MSTDAGTEGSPKAELSLAAELEKAAELLKQHKPEKAAALLKKSGLDHAADKLLAPEAHAEPKKKARAAKAAKVKAAPAEKKAKPTKKAASKRDKATSGQSGPVIKGLTWDDLNKKEKLLLGCFELEGEREIRSIDQLAGEAFKSQTVKKQNSWARNSLRRLVRSEPAWLEKTEPGKYRLTTHARNALKR